MATITNIDDRDVRMRTNGAATPPPGPALPRLNCFLRPCIAILGHSLQVYGFVSIFTEFWA
jgi:hypothetical protein